MSRDIFVDNLPTKGDKVFAHSAPILRQSPDQFLFNLHIEKINRLT